MPFINRCGDAPKLQTKTVTPTTSQQIITPDTGYEGLEKVVVNAPALQDKTVTVDGTVTPDEGYIGIEQLMIGTTPNVYESVSSTWDYYRTDGSIDYNKRKFSLPGITSKQSTFPDIVFIPMPFGPIVKNKPEYKSYIASVLIVRQLYTYANGKTSLHDPVQLSGSASTKDAYRITKVRFDPITAWKYDDYVGQDASEILSGDFLTFNEEDSCFIVGAQWDTGTSVEYNFLGTASIPAEYKAYFIWW